MVVTGRVLDGDGRPVRHQLVEIWQANAGGRYIHKRDQHPAADRPATSPASGRCLTDADGTYPFTTIKPGPYPWKNHRNAWRPAHIHFSLFGTDFTQRMVTQMYFPGDPLFALDPIYQSITDPRARERLVATYDHDVTAARVVHRLPLGHRAHRQPPHPDARRTSMTLAPTPGQTVGPFFGYALPYDGGPELVPPGPPDAIRLHGRVLDGAGDPVPDALLELWQADAGRSRSRSEPGSLRRDGFTFTGWGRAATDDDGPLRVHDAGAGAVVPGAAPFFALTVFARGLLDRLFTRAYLPGDDARSAPTRCSPRYRPAPGDPGRDRGRRAASSSTSGCRATGETVFLTYRARLTLMSGPLLARRRAGRATTSRDAPSSSAMVAVEEAWLAVLGVEGASLHADLDDWLDGGLAAATPRPAATRSIAAGREPACRARGRSAGGSTLAAPRPDQPGRRRHRADDAGARTRSPTLVTRAAPTRSARWPTSPSAHRDTPMVARTLTQHAVPTTFGLKVAAWLTGVLDAYDDVAGSTFPVQVGGAAGTLAAVVELGRDPAATRAALARALGLADVPPWHTTRRPVTRIGDAAGRAAPTPGAGSPTTCSPCRGPRSASWPRARAAGRRRCRTRPTRCCRCWSAVPR